MSASLALHVLVVDDVPLNLTVAAAMLRHLGCRVSLAADGSEAVAAVRAGAFDLVLMDLQMPRLDGLAATRRIRQLPGSQAAVPVVGVTASVYPKLDEACLTAGMQAVLNKPILIKDLAGLLRPLRR